MDNIYNTDMDAMYRDFVRNKGDVAAQIREALQMWDFKLAHRLAHTLKGIAGLMYEKDLANIAKRIEEILRTTSIPTEFELEELEYQVEKLLQKIELYFENNDAPKVAGDDDEFDKESATKLFDWLEENLTARRGDVLDTVEKLRAIPKTQALITNIEDFEFADALENLEKLRQTLEV